jgi:hypothetical protein
MNPDHIYSIHLFSETGEKSFMSPTMDYDEVMEIISAGSLQGNARVYNVVVGEYVEIEKPAI